MPLTARFPIIALCALAMCACGGHPAGKDSDDDKGAAKPAAAAKDSDAKDKDKDKDKEGVTLTPEQIAKLGVTTQPAAGGDYADETAGYGLILSHDAIAQSVSEWQAAQATAHFSAAAVARARSLKGTAGALSADTEDSLAQKAAVDDAASTLSSRKLSAQFGMNPPWAHGDHTALLERIAVGEDKLLRATFPLGALPEGTPHGLRAQRIGSARPAKDWWSTRVWDAPADSSVPGRSFFALISHGDAQEGERVQVFAPNGSSSKGTIVPESSVVMSEGKFWCYVGHDAGAFTRVEVDTGKRTPKGYFVTEGIAPGDNIVVHAAAQLLAKETGAESDSDE